MPAHRSLQFLAATFAVMLAACPPPTAEPSTATGVGAPVGDPVGQGGPPGGPGTPPPDGAGGPGTPSGNADQPCGDGVCDEPETQDPTLCPRDCQEKPTTGDDWCGDGICDALESDQNSCPDDCLNAAPGDGGPVGLDGGPGVQPSAEGQPISPEDVPSMPGMEGPPPDGAAPPGDALPPGTPPEGPPPEGPPPEGPPPTDAQPPAGDN